MTENIEFTNKIDKKFQSAIRQIDEVRNYYEILQHRGNSTEPMYIEEETKDNIDTDIVISKNETNELWYKIINYYKI